MTAPERAFHPVSPAAAAHHSLALTGPGFVEKAARTWVCLAGAYYVYDLLQLAWGGMTAPDGRAFGEDFINYWSGAWLAWHGQAADVYRMSAYHAFQETVVGPGVGYYSYIYPPVILLLTGPFAALPYVPALFAWLISSWYCFYRALRLAMPGRRVLLLALATPALFVSVRGGQNGAWTAALLGGGLALLGRAPIAAGILFGLQVYKPHLGVLIPVALIAGRQWRAFGSAALTVAALLAATVVLFGVDVWSEYARALPALRQIVLEEAVSNWHRIVSVFIAARRLGADVPVAYAVQAVAGLIAAAIVAAAWFRDAPAPVKNAALVLGTFLTAPYVLDYDLVVGAFVAAWLTDRSVMPQPMERWIMISVALVLLAPLLVGILAKLIGLELGPLFFIPAFVITARLIPRRSRAESRHAGSSPLPADRLAVQ